MPFLACRRQNWSLRTRALEPSVGVRWLFPPRGCKHSFGQDTDRRRNHSPPRAQGIGWLLPQHPGDPASGMLVVLAGRRGRARGWEAAGPSVPTRQRPGASCRSPRGAESFQKDEEVGL